MLKQKSTLEVASLPTAEVDGLRDHCGVWAIWDPQNTALLDNAFTGLNGIQHRGEEGAGVAVISSTHEGIHYVRGHGKVIDVFSDDGAGLRTLPADAHAAIGHTWYGTDSAKGDGIQPRVESSLALAHNGQFTNKDELSKLYAVSDYSSDTDLVTKIIDKVAMESCGGDVERATIAALPTLRGAFCLTILTQDKLIAVRDRHGVRPLQLGLTETGGYIVSSEVKAIEEVPHATWDSEIEPAEMVVISASGLRRGLWTKADPAVCVFEYAYLSNKTNIINNIKVEDARRAFGKILASHVSSRASAVVPIPNSGIQAAHGLAEATGVPYVAAFTKNKQHGRSFLQPNDAARIQVADDKLTLKPDLVHGQHVVAVDDTLVRGHTAAVNVKKLRQAGAASIELFVAAPPYGQTCELGVDTGNPDELIAARTGGSVEKMREELAVDRLVFLSTADIRSVLGEKVCDFCIGGKKPNMVAAEQPLTAIHSGRLALSAVSA